MMALIIIRWASVIIKSVMYSIDMKLPNNELCVLWAGSNTIAIESPELSDITVPAPIIADKIILDISASEIPSNVSSKTYKNKRMEDVGGEIGISIKMNAGSVMIKEISSRILAGTFTSPIPGISRQNAPMRQNIIRKVYTC